MTTIDPLNITDTFNTWFNKTNTVIAELNKDNVYQIFAGDGMGVTYNINGGYTLSIGNSLIHGITFLGDVIFNGSVSFGGVVPAVPNTTFKITPAVAGLTSGNIVRVDPINGLTLSQANSASNSEVFGIVMDQTGSGTVVAMSGAVVNTVFANTVSNSLGIVGGTYIAGRAYFLSPTIPGGLTTIEPNTYGHVSKPVILGITGNSGVFLPYRGILVEGISAGISAELDNKIIVRIADIETDGTGRYNSVNPVKIGDFVYYTDDDTGAMGRLDTLTGIAGLTAYKIAGKLNYSSNINAMIPNFNDVYTWNYDFLIGSGLLGIVSNILSDTIVGTLKTVLLEVTTPNGSFNANIADLDSELWRDTTKTQPLTLSGNNIGAVKRLMGVCGAYGDNGNGSHKILDFVKINNTTAKIIFSKEQTNSVDAANQSNIIGVMNSGITIASEYDNLIPNGSFSVWQRGIVGLTAGSLGTYSTPWADRWFVTKNDITMTTATVTRQTFTSDQTDVPGSPLYYTDCRFSYSGSPTNSQRPKLENIQKEARLLQGQWATLSFWAKSTSNTSTMDLVFNRYRDTYTTTLGVTTDITNRQSVIQGVSFDDSNIWQEYSYDFTVDPWGVTLSPQEKGWFSVGFEFPNQSSTISIAQVQLDVRGSNGPLAYISPEKELERCKPYYQRTYNLNQNNGWTGDSNQNECVVQLGNLSSQKSYFVKFPTEMVNTPTVSLYAPNGSLGDAYNLNAKQNMTSAADGSLVTYPWSSGNYYRTSNPNSYGNITLGNRSKQGTYINVYNGALSLDTILFHYIADADLNLNV